MRLFGERQRGGADRQRSGCGSSPACSHLQISKRRGRVVAASIDPTDFSGHSLRGFATSAVQAGVSTFKITSQTGHASDAMLSRYVRDGELFVNNAAGALL